MSERPQPPALSITPVRHSDKTSTSNQGGISPGLLTPDGRRPSDVGGEEPDSRTPSPSAGERAKDRFRKLLGSSRLVGPVDLDTTSDIETQDEQSLRISNLRAILVETYKSHLKESAEEKIEKEVYDPSVPETEATISAKHVKRFESTLTDQAIENIYEATLEGLGKINSINLNRTTSQSRSPKRGTLSRTNSPITGTSLTRVTRPQRSRRSSNATSPSTSVIDPDGDDDESAHLCRARSPSDATTLLDYTVIFQLVEAARTSGVWGSKTAFPKYGSAKFDRLSNRLLGIARQLTPEDYMNTAPDEGGESSQGYSAASSPQRLLPRLAASPSRTVNTSGTRGTIEFYDSLERGGSAARGRRRER